MKPTIGLVVHYVSYGTPRGEYPSAHRAAVVTAVYDDPGFVDLCVLNPTGLHFPHHVPESAQHEGGTWHWPEHEQE